MSEEVISEEVVSEEVIDSAAKKPSKGKIIAIIILVVVIAAAAVVGVLFVKNYTAPEAQLERAEAAGDEDAIEDLLEKYGDEITDSEDVATIYNTKIEEIERSFLAETIDYAAAVAELDQIEAKGITGTQKKLDDVRSSLEELNNSRIAFDTAESFFSAESYIEAVDYYKQVIEDDPNYSSIDAKIEACYSNYRSKALAEAEAMVTSGSYEDAIGTLKSALNVLPNDATIQQQIAIYESKLTDLSISDALANAASYFEAGDYVNAIRAIEGTYKANPDNYQLQARYDEYVAAYEQKVLSDADALAAERKYDQAIERIKGAQSVLPDSQALKDKIAALESSRPTALSNLTVINGGWEWNKGTPEDPFGNNYSGCVNFAILEGNSWDPKTISAEYRTDGKYATLTGDLIPYTSIGQDASYKIMVYTDDGSDNFQLVYTSAEIGRKTDRTSFEASIAGAKYVKIDVVLGTDADAILANLQLWPK